MYTCPEISLIHEVFSKVRGHPRMENCSHIAEAVQVPGFCLVVSLFLLLAFQ